jgi:hypothetical protein
MQISTQHEASCDLCGITAVQALTPLMNILKWLFTPGLGQLADLVDIAL